MNKIILASSSPRRKELLERTGIDFIIDASSIEETLDDTLPLEQRLQKLAVDKATPIHKNIQMILLLVQIQLFIFKIKLLEKLKMKMKQNIF